MASSPSPRIVDSSAPEPLLERERELRRVSAAVDEAERGFALVVIEGPAGIGKSSLLQAAQRLARERGRRVRAVRVSELDRDASFGVALALTSGDPRPATAEPSRWDLPSGEAEARARASLVAALERTVDAGPTVLTIDDLHWCDVESLSVIAEALVRLESRRCAVLVARRTGGADVPPGLDGVVRAPGATILRLRPLTESAVAALVARALSKSPDPAFARACREASDGNPFLLRELLLELAARGVKPTAANAVRVPDIRAPAVAWLIAARLARVSARARALAEAVAVLGEDFPAQAPERLAGLARDEALDAAHELVGAGIFDPGPVAAFAHAMLRSALLDGLSPNALAASHRHAARVLAGLDASPSVVARQLLRSDPTGDPLVVEQLQLAAEAAAARGAPAAAAALLRRALVEPPDESQRPRVQFALGAALAAAGDVASVEHLEAAIAVHDEPDRRSDAALLLARMHAALGRYDAAETVVRRALAAPGVEAERRLALEAELIYVASFAGEPMDTVLDEPGLDTPALLLAHLADHLSRKCTRREEALALARRALADPGLAAEESSLGFVHAIGVLDRADLFSEALRGLDEATAIIEDRGLAYNRQIATTLRAVVLAHSGRLEAAAAAAGTAVADADGSEPVRLYAGGVLAGILRELGRADRAWELLQRQACRATEYDQGIVLAPVHLAYAALHRDAGRCAESHREAQRCGALLTATHSDTPALLAWRSEAALALAGIGEMQQAVGLAERELGDARLWGASRPIARALRTRAAIGAPLAAVEALREASALLGGSEALLERAEVEVALGVALLGVGERQEAREVLARGVERSELCGAAPLAARGRDALIRAGGRPRRRTVGMDALTPAERNVAQLAATGATNAQIAARLVISQATVASHLHRAYRKLGLRSRSQLATALERGEH